MALLKPVYYCLIVIVVIVISKLLKRHSKSKRRSSAYSRALRQIRWIVLRIVLGRFTFGCQRSEQAEELLRRVWFRGRGRRQRTRWVSLTIASYTKPFKKLQLTHNVDDLRESQSEGDVEGIGRIDWWSDPRVVVTHQVAHQLVLELISNDYNSKADESYKMNTIIADKTVWLSSLKTCLWLGA